MAGHPPRGRPPTTPAACSPHRACRPRGQCWAPTPTHPRPQPARGWRTPTARPVGGQSGEGQRLTSGAPHDGGRHPPGDALPPPPQRATPARKGARCGAGAGSPRPHRPHPGHTGRGTPAARSRGRAAGGGTAPNTKRPSQRWQATPPRGRPPTTPAACSPHRACRPRGQCWAPTPTHPRPQHVGGGPQQPAQWAGSRGRDGAWPQSPLTMVEGTPPGDALPPPPQRATPARKGARYGAGAGSPRPHRPHPGHTGRGTPAARSRGRAAGGGTAPDTKRPSQRWQATPPGDGPPPPPRHAAPTGHAGRGDSVGPPHPHTRAHSQHVGGGPQQPAQWAGSRGRDGAWPQTPLTMVEGTPPGDAPPPPPQRATPAHKGARCGAGAGSTRPHQPHPGHTGRGTQAARSRGRAAGGGTAPDTRRPSQRWQATPPGDGPPPPPRHAAPTGHAGQGDSVGPPHPHTRAHSTWVADPNSPPSGRAVGGGTAPGPRRPPQWWKAPPPGTPSRHPHSEQRRPARAHTVGPVLGPHARTDRTRDTRVAEPWLPAPEDGRPGEGQRLTPSAPHNGGRPPPPGTAPHPPRGMQPPQGMQAAGTVLGPHTHTPAPTARGWRTPTARPVGGQSGEGRRLASDAPHDGGRHPPRGRPPATPTASNAGPQGRTLWGRCWVPAPAPTAPGTHGSRNPGCPLQRTGGRGRDSA